MSGKFIAVIIGIVLGLMFFIPIDKFLVFGITLILLLIGLFVLFYTKKVNKYDVFAGVLGYFTIMIILLFYLVPGYAISAGQGTVLSENWWEALNWVKGNTEECAVIATYWDPGHFIVSVAERPVVFDGAGQNVLYTRPVNTTDDGLVLDSHDKGIVQIKLYKDGNLTTARIKDIGITLFTDNETLAYNLMKEYKKDGCNEMYFIASADLVYKSQWWTYFATWDPIKIDKKGTMYNYIPIQLARRKPLFSYNTVGYEYPVSDRQSFVIYEQNGTYRGLFMQDNQFVRVNKIVYPTQYGYVNYEEPDAEIKGTLFLADSSMNMIFFFPPELENSMFTRMFFYNGQGLENFEYVNTWGGEFKLFKIKFNQMQ